MQIILLKSVLLKMQLRLVSIVTHTKDNANAIKNRSIIYDAIRLGTLFNYSKFQLKIAKDE